MYTIERYYPKVGVGQTLKQHLEYFSSYEHFSKLKRKTHTWVYRTKYNLTLTLAEGQTEKKVCAIERSYPNVGVGQILGLYLEYFSNYVQLSKLKRKT